MGLKADQIKTVRIYDRPDMFYGYASAEVRGVQPHAIFCSVFEAE